MTSIGYRAFAYCDSLTIYCEAVTKPAGWDNDWNPNNRPVVWDCNGEDDEEPTPIPDGLSFSPIGEDAYEVSG